MKKTLKAIGITFAVLVVLSATAVFASAAGNSMQEATPISLNTDYSGMITETYAIDFYSFTLPESGRINVRLTAHIYGSHYFIYDADGNEVWKKTHQYWNNVTEEYNLGENVDLTSGTYYFSVWQYDGTGNYNFKLSFTDAKESFSETSWGTNNSIADASAISTGKTYNGQIALNDSKDIYKFTLSKSGTLNVRLTAYIYAAHYIIYDADGSEVWEKTYQYWNSTTKEYDINENVDLTSGTYYFSVGHYDGTGNYNFKLSFTDAKESFSETSWGTNNSIADASAISTGKTYNGQIALNDSKDIYKFTLSKSGSVNVRLTAYIYAAHYIIYDADGNEVWEKTYQYWNSTTKEYDINENVELTSGDYYFSVGQYNGTGNYNFKLSFTDAKESFAETLWGTNNSISDASTISLGRTYNGQIALNDSKDIYKFTLLESGTVNVRLTAYIYAAHYVIYDADGSEVWEKTYQYWNKTTKEYDLDENVDLSAGTYYFSVGQYNGTGNYFFSIGRGNPFEDVSKDAYFYDPVLWAVENDVTSGTSKTTFAPDNPCTRGQVVTFLWRSAGQPKPKSAKNPFTDVSSGDYFYRAVLWAVENGITAGTSKTKFSPDSTCTRGQIVTFLYRANGSPKLSGSKNPFKDVKTSDYFYSAVLWAVGKDITKGTSASAFSPDSTCTRAQVVTFLYRDVVN